MPKPHHIGRRSPLPADVFQSGLGGRNLEAVYQRMFGANPILPPVVGGTAEQVKQARENLGVPPVPYTGKDIGIKRVIPAGTTNELGVMHYGEPSLKHYRATCATGALFVAGTQTEVPPSTLTGGAGLRFRVYGTYQNEEIPPRKAYVSAGDARPIYVSGTSMRVTVTNDTAYDIEANVGLDEIAPGFSDFWDFEQVTVIGAVPAENQLDIPAFCRSFTVLIAPGGAAGTLSAYAPGGALVFQTALTAPNSGPQERIPGLLYTLTIVATTATVYYYCAG